MQVMELKQPVAGVIDRRLESLKQVRVLCGRLAPAREQHYAEVMTAAGAATASGSAREGAVLALDLLSLELCDD